jgi:hypothetical protein
LCRSFVHGASVPPNIWRSHRTTTSNREQKRPLSFGCGSAALC